MSELSGTETLAEILPAQASRKGLSGKTALFFGEHQYTYRDLDGASAGLASILRGHGFGPDDIIALLLPNSPAVVVAMFAILRIGATVLPLNPRLTATELGFILGDSRARLLITTAETTDSLKTLSSLPEILCIAPVPTPPESVSFPDRVTRGSDRSAFLIYTSGSTGRPKGVLLTHRNVLANTEQVAERTGVTPEDRVLHLMPLFHTNGLMNNTILPLRIGASIVLRPRFDLEEFWPVVRTFRPTYFTAVPTVLARIMAAWDGTADISSLRFARTGAAPISVSLHLEVERRLEVPLIVSYGLTEATCTCTMNPVSAARRIGSVGLPLRGQEVAVVDDLGQPQPAGVAGEIIVRGQNVMAQYLNDPAATAETVVDGWLRTGDLGYLDQDDFLVLTDRRKDLIIRAGENVSPREVEEVLVSHPAIAEAAVVGAPHPEWGEEVCAFVVPRSEGILDPDDVRTFCRERLAHFKVPGHVRVVSFLPLSNVGKVDKVRLRSETMPVH
jgi:acyl-CoA synthetase (AMP-forming)/AMP-acid ligase II